MAKDYSKFGTIFGDVPKKAATRLERLGWQNFFMRQAVDHDLQTTPPVRVMGVHRAHLDVMSETAEMTIPMVEDVTVGDWLLYNPELPTRSERLERKSLFKRGAAGKEYREQAIAANVDTAFIVTSCNEDFSVARLERYLALSWEAEVQAVIVLTKIDKTDDVSSFMQQAQAISDQVPVLAVNGKAEDVGDVFAPWCKTGQTVAFLGSSGVGKSTLVNAIFGSVQAETSAIREADAKGRHTTTSRQMYLTQDRGVLLDTPGMRELKMTDMREGLREVFQDIEELATQCRFRDCAHETEPACAVRNALENGEITADRLERWQKLVAEDRLHSETVHERKTRERSFGKTVRAAQNAKLNRSS